MSVHHRSGRPARHGARAIGPALLALVAGASPVFAEDAPISAPVAGITVQLTDRENIADGGSTVESEDEVVYLQPLQPRLPAQPLRLAPLPRVDQAMVMHADSLATLEHPPLMGPSVLSPSDVATDDRSLEAVAVPNRLPTAAIGPAVPADPPLATVAARALNLPQEALQSLAQPPATGTGSADVPNASDQMVSASISPLPNQSLLFNRLGLAGDALPSDPVEYFDDPQLPKQIGSPVRIATSATYGDLAWMGAAYTWAAPAMFHQPLYFEQVNLERYGQGTYHAIQPFASSAHFFANVAILPYRVWKEPYHQKVYTLGHYRPGDCAPYQWHRHPH